MLECEFCGNPNPVFLGVSQLANLLGYTEQEIRRRCRAGLVPAAEKVTVGKKVQWRIPRSAAVRYYQEMNGLDG